MKKFLLIFALVIGAQAQTHIIAGKAEIVNPADFTNTAYQCFLCSNLNNFKFTDVPTYGSIYRNQDAVAGGIIIPAGAVLSGNGDGVAGYCVSNADSRSGGSGNPGIISNCVDFWGVSIANANNSAAWGINIGADDQPGTLGTYLIGGEYDIGVSGTPNTMVGLQINVGTTNTGTLPANNSFGINILSKPFGGVQQPIAQGLELSDGCCNQGIEFGVANPVAASTGSQNEHFCWLDGSSARHCSVFVFADGAGGLDFQVATGGVISINTGDLSFGTGKGQHIDTFASQSDISGVCTSASGTTCTVTFTRAYTGVPACVVTPTASAGAFYISTNANTGFVVTYANSGAMTFNYVCIGSPD